MLDSKMESLTFKIQNAYACVCVFQINSLPRNSQVNCETGKYTSYHSKTKFYRKLEQKGQKDTSNLNQPIEIYRWQYPERSLLKFKPNDGDRGGKVNEVS